MNFTHLLEEPCIENIEVLKKKFVFIDTKDTSIPPENFSTNICEEIKKFGKSKVIYLIENYNHWSNKSKNLGFIYDYLDRNRIFTVSCIDRLSVSLFSNINNLSRDIEFLKKMCENMDKHYYPTLLADFLYNYTDLYSMKLDKELHIRLIQSILHTTIIDKKSLATTLSDKVIVLSKCHKHFLMCHEKDESKKILQKELINCIREVKVLLKHFFKIPTVWKMMSYIQQYPGKVFIIQGQSSTLKHLKELLRYSLKSVEQNRLRMYNHINL